MFVTVHDDVLDDWYDHYISAHDNACPHYAWYVCCEANQFEIVGVVIIIINNNKESKYLRNAFLPVRAR